MAMALLGQQDYSQAELFLEDLVQQLESHYRVPASWYMALIKIGQEQKEEAILHLKSMQNSDPPLSVELEI